MERFELQTRIAEVLIGAYERTPVGTIEHRHARYSQRARKGWRTRKAMAKARKKP